MKFLVLLVLFVVLLALRRVDSLAVRAALTSFGVTTLALVLWSLIVEVR